MAKINKLTEKIAIALDGDVDNANRIYRILCKDMKKILENGTKLHREGYTSYFYLHGMRCAFTQLKLGRIR
jgi:hypothetical protein